MSKILLTYYNINDKDSKSIASAINFDNYVFCRFYLLINKNKVSLFLDYKAKVHT